MPQSRTARVQLTRGALALWDVLAWFAAMTAFVGARYDFNLKGLQWKWAVIYACVAAVLQLALGFATKLYRGRHRIGSTDEVVLLTSIVIGIGAVLGAYYGFFKPQAPRGEFGFPQGVVMTAPFGALLIMAFGHFVARAFAEHAQVGKRVVETPAEPVLIYGAGNAGQQLGRLIHNDPDSPYEVRGFLDDGADKRNLHLFGTKVHGGFDDMVQIADDLGVETVILAIGTADKAMLNKVNRRADAHGLKLLTLPPVRDMVGGVSLSQLHQVDVAVLLGRSKMKSDLSPIAGNLEVKVVEITGAGAGVKASFAPLTPRW